MVVFVLASTGEREGGRVNHLHEMANPLYVQKQLVGSIIFDMPETVQNETGVLQPLGPIMK